MTLRLSDDERLALESILSDWLMPRGLRKYSALEDDAIMLRQRCLYPRTHRGSTSLAYLRSHDQPSTGKTPPEPNGPQADVTNG